MTEIAYIILIIATTLFMKRGGYGWVGSVLTGLISPLGYIILFTIILLPIQFLLGKLRVSEEVIPSGLIEIGTCITIVGAWCILGWFLTRKKSERPQEKEMVTLVERK